MPLIFILGILAAWYFGLFSAFESHTYRAEVGYYNGGQQAWYVGSDKSREACTSEAINYYNSLNAERQGRAFSWACREMQGEKFLARVR